MSEEKTTSFPFASNTLPLPQSKDLLEPAIQSRSSLVLTQVPAVFSRVIQGSLMQMICIGICRVSYFGSAPFYYHIFIVLIFFLLLH